MIGVAIDNAVFFSTASLTLTPKMTTLPGYPSPRWIPSLKKHEAPEMPLLLDWTLRVYIPFSASVRFEVPLPFNEERN